MYVPEVAACEGTLVMPRTNTGTCTRTFTAAVAGLVAVRIPLEHAIDRLSALTQHLHQLTCHAGRLVRREERVGHALAVAARRTTDAVHVVVDVLGEVEVHHERDVADVCGEAVHWTVTNADT